MEAYSRFAQEMRKLERPERLQAKIDSIMNNVDLSSADRTRQVYDAWIATVAENPDPKTLRLWKETLPKNFPDRPILSKLLPPAYVDRLKTILGPKLLFDDRDFLNFAIYFHEAIHSLNHNQARVRGYLLAPGDIRNPKLRARYRFVDEQAAMAGEWQFLNSLPAKIRFRIAEQISKDPSTPAYLKELGPRMLRNASMDLDAYPV